MLNTVGKAGIVIGVGITLQACAVAPGGVVGAPIFTTSPTVVGAQEPGSPVAAIGRAQSFAGMQATEAQTCPTGMVEADREYRQRQRIDERVDLGAGQFAWGRNRREVRTRTNSDIVCVRVKYDWQGEGQ